MMIQKKNYKPGCFGLFLYNAKTRKYYLVSQSTTIYYLSRLVSEKYSGCLWKIALVKL